MKTKVSKHQLRNVIDAVEKEFLDAIEKFDAFNSGHEGYAVIKEELDELWEEIKNKNCKQPELFSEAKQVAAMAIRFMIDICLTQIKQ